MPLLRAAAPVLPTRLRAVLICPNWGTHSLPCSFFLRTSADNTAQTTFGGESKCSKRLVLSPDLRIAQKNGHFSSLFCGFSLRSFTTLAIVPSGPGLMQENRGSELAACPGLTGADRQIRRISRLDGQADEQIQNRVAQGRKVRAPQQRRRSLFV